MSEGQLSENHRIRLLVFKGLLQQAVHRLIARDVAQQVGTVLEQNLAAETLNVFCITDSTGQKHDVVSTKPTHGSGVLTATFNVSDLRAAAGQMAFSANDAAEWLSNSGTEI